LNANRSGQRLNRDPARCLMLIDAGACFEGQEDGTQVGMVHKRLGVAITGPPGFLRVELFNLLGKV
jgi:hypothetical protein